MNSRGQAFVSIVTPVYNGERYLRDCVDSVLSQTHTNWEYIILNNASTDKTLEIAKEYEGRDRRINVFSNEALLPIIANHNKAFSLISPKSKYCKVVSADDVIFPQCIEKMVALADQHPTIGLVGSYQIRGGDETWSLQNHGLPFYRTMIPGAEVCRDHLLGKVRVFGNPTSVMYRADLVRGTPESIPIRHLRRTRVHVLVRSKSLISDLCIRFCLMRESIRYGRRHGRPVSTPTFHHVSPTF